MLLAAYLARTVPAPAIWKALAPGDDVQEVAAAPVAVDHQANAMTDMRSSIASLRARIAALEHELDAEKARVETYKHVVTSLTNERDAKIAELKEILERR